MFFSCFGQKKAAVFKIVSKTKRRKNMYKSFSMNLAGRTLTVDIGRVAKQANGAAFMHYGDTTLLCTATASDKPREGIDFCSQKITEMM